MDLEHRAQVRRARVDDRRERTDAGAAHEDVDLGHLEQARLDGRLVGDVELRVADLAERRVMQRARWCAPPERDHGRALARERLGARRADAARPAGHHRVLAEETLGHGKEATGASDVRLQASGPNRPDRRVGFPDFVDTR